MVNLVGNTFTLCNLSSLIIELQYLPLLVFAQPLRGAFIPDRAIKRLFSRQLGSVLVRPRFVVTPIILSGPVTVLGFPPGVSVTMCLSILGRPYLCISPRADDAGSRQSVTAGGRLVKMVGRQNLLTTRAGFTRPT